MTASKKAIEGWAKSPTDAIIRDLIYGLREQPWISREDIAVILERDLLPRAEATAAAEQRLRDVIQAWDAAMVALIATNDHDPIPEFLPVADAIKSARTLLDSDAPEDRPTRCAEEGCVRTPGHVGAHTSRPYWPRELRDELAPPPASPRQGEPVVEPGLCGDPDPAHPGASCTYVAGHGGSHANRHYLWDNDHPWRALSEPAEAGEPG